MDGPAFHLARKGIDGLKKSGGLLRIMWPDSRGQSLIDAVLDLVSHEEGQWKTNRLQIYREMLNGVNIQAIAAETRLSPAAVCKSIKAGALHTISALCQEICALINLTLARK